MHLASHQNTPRGCISLAKSACFFLTQPLEKKPSATRICTVDARLPQSLNCAASLEMRLATTLIPLWITAALSQFWFPKAALWLRCLLQILWREYIQVPKFKEFWSFTSCSMGNWRNSPHQRCTSSPVNPGHFTGVFIDFAYLEQEFHSWNSDIFSPPFHQCTRKCRDRLKCLQILLIKGWLFLPAVVKQQQEEISRNHLPSLFAISVFPNT